MNKKVKRILSFAENIKIFKGSIVARFRDMVPDGGTVTFYLLTRPVHRPSINRIITGVPINRIAFGLTD